MKKLIKKAVAVFMVVILVATLVPTWVFATEIETEVDPGVLLVVTSEVYTEEELTELLSGIAVESVSDIYLSIVEDILLINPDYLMPDRMKHMIGMSFKIILQEKTVEAVYEAIEKVERISGISSAEPNYIYASSPDIFPENPEDYPPYIEPWGTYLEFYDSQENVYYVPTTACIEYQKRIEEKYGLEAGSINSKNTTLERFFEIDGVWFADIYHRGYPVNKAYKAVLIDGYTLFEYQQDDSFYVFNDFVAYTLEEGLENGFLSQELFVKIVDKLNEKDYPTQSLEMALFALRITAGFIKLTPMMIELYDVDLDGGITVSDALSHLRVAAKLA